MQKIMKELFESSKKEQDEGGGCPFRKDMSDAEILKVVKEMMGSDDSEEDDILEQMKKGLGEKQAAFLFKKAKDDMDSEDSDEKSLKQENKKGLTKSVQEMIEEVVNGADPKEIIEAKTLNQVLSDLGLKTRPGKFPSEKDILKNGKVVFSGTAGDVWKWLRDEKLIEGIDLVAFGREVAALDKGVKALMGAILSFDPSHLISKKTLDQQTIIKRDLEIAEKKKKELMDALRKVFKQTQLYK